MTDPTPTDVFRDLVITFLTPMFLATTGGDLTHARAAAAHTVAVYNARNPADMLIIAQVIALGLAMLSSLSLSMADSVPIPLILRLRGNAASLHRAAEQCRRTLRTDAGPAAEQHLPPVRTDVPEQPARPSAQESLQSVICDSQQCIAELDATLLAASRAAGRQSGPADAAPASDSQRRQAWATAMTRAARDSTTGLEALSPAERQQASIRATVLSSVAQDLLSARPVPPADFRLGKP